MELALWMDADGALDLSADRISQMSNADLLHVVRLLERRDAEQRAVERDHRQYLQRHELERLVFLAARLHRRPRGNPVTSTA